MSPGMRNTPLDEMRQRVRRALSYTPSRYGEVTTRGTEKTEFPILNSHPMGIENCEFCFLCVSFVVTSPQAARSAARLRLPNRSADTTVHQVPDERREYAGVNPPARI